MAIKGRKNSLKCQKNDEKVELCALCSKVSDDSYLGKMLTTPTMNAHENCLLFSPILKQLHDPDIERKGFIMGFKISDVEKERKRIARLKCCVCRKSYAGVGCSNVTCRKSFHVSCGLNGKAFGIFKDTFQFYCTDHAPTQNLQKQLNSCNNIVPECTICLDSLIDNDKDGCDSQWLQLLTKVNLREVLHGLCCSRCWMHRSCIRQYGLSAGLHHVKCPQCSDKNTFIESVQLCGIWLPDRDASWELVPGAYQDLYDEPREDAEATSESCLASATCNGDHEIVHTSDNCDTENTPMVTVNTAIAAIDDPELSQSTSIEIVECHVAVEPVVVAPFVRVNPPLLRKRSRPSESPSKEVKKRRTSKTANKIGVIHKRQCVRCQRSIVSLNCNQASVLSEANQNKQLVDVAAPKMEYVCVSCHR